MNPRGWKNVVCKRLPAGWTIERVAGLYKRVIKSMPMSMQTACGNRRWCLTEAQEYGLSMDWVWRWPNEWRFPPNFCRGPQVQTEFWASALAHPARRLSPPPCTRLPSVQDFWNHDRTTPIPWSHHILAFLAKFSVNIAVIWRLFYIAFVWFAAWRQLTKELWNWFLYFHFP